LNNRIHLDQPSQNRILTYLEPYLWGINALFCEPILTFFYVFLTQFPIFHFFFTLRRVRLFIFLAQNNWKSFSPTSHWPTRAIGPAKLLMEVCIVNPSIWLCTVSAGIAVGHGSVINIALFSRTRPEKITFTENATVMTVKEGEKATILCEVKGEPQPNVTWHFNGQPISAGGKSPRR